MNFKEEIKDKTAMVDELLETYLPEEKDFSRELAEAINYSMKAGGKRLRPLMMWETYCMFGGKGKVVQPFMAAIEMIHTHSLIHDDLPAIDNDTRRRGKKTTWCRYGESVGILSGDALLNYAYEVALRSFEMEEKKERIALAIQVLSCKTGIDGMLGGQSVDVANDGKEISEDMLLYIYKKKTASLIAASFMIGAILAGAPGWKVRVIETMAENVGLAFQIRDDILDLTGKEEIIGKPLHSDEKNNKVTYVSLHGLEAAQEKVRELSDEALALFDSLEQKNEFLRMLIIELSQREK